MAINSFIVDNGQLAADRCLILQNDLSIEESQLHSLAFERLPEVSDENSQWSDCEIRDAINLVYQNLHKLESYLSTIVSVLLVSRSLYFCISNRTLCL